MATVPFKMKSNTTSHAANGLRAPLRREEAEELAQRRRRARLREAFARASVLEWSCGELGVAKVSWRISCCCFKCVLSLKNCECDEQGRVGGMQNPGTTPTALQAAMNQGPNLGIEQSLLGKQF